MPTFRKEPSSSYSGKDVFLCATSGWLVGRLSLRWASICSVLDASTVHNQPAGGIGKRGHSRRQRVPPENPYFKSIPKDSNGHGAVYARAPIIESVHEWEPGIQPYGGLSEGLAGNPCRNELHTQHLAVLKMCRRLEVSSTLVVRVVRCWYLKLVQVVKVWMMKCPQGSSDHEAKQRYTPGPVGFLGED